MEASFERVNLLPEGANSFSQDKASNKMGGNYLHVRGIFVQYICIPLKFGYMSFFPANTQRRNTVVTTSLQRHDVAATLYVC